MHVRLSLKKPIHGLLFVESHFAHFADVHGISFPEEAGAGFWLTRQALKLLLHACTAVSTSTPENLGCR